jgi:hypothetical protein
MLLVHQASSYSERFGAGHGRSIHSETSDPLPFRAHCNPFRWSIMVIRFLRMRPQSRSSTVKFTAMRRTILILFTVAGFSSQEAFAGDCDAHSGCRKFSIYQAAPTYGPPPFVAFGSTVGPIVGCYGFDHGPIYSPHACNFPYPCEYYGTCKAAAKPYKGTF